MTMTVKIAAIFIVLSGCGRVILADPTDAQDLGASVDAGPFLPSKDVLPDAQKEQMPETSDTHSSVDAGALSLDTHPETQPTPPCPGGTYQPEQNAWLCP